MRKKLTNMLLPLRSISSTLCWQMLITFTICSQVHANALVEVVKPILSNEAQTLQVSGSLTTEKRSLLSPRMDGLVVKVNVDAGSEVKQNDVLIQLDPALVQHQLAQAKANVAKAIVGRDEAQRLVAEAERLRTNNHIPQSELAKRKAALELTKPELLAVKAAQANIEEMLRRHTLTAPYSGVISKKMTEAGEWVSRGDAVLELVNLDAIRLDVNVPQERFADINKDTLVNVIPDAYPSELLSGQIQAIVPVSDAAVRAFLVRITLDNKSRLLLPGNSATAIFNIQGQAQNLIVPRDALLHHPDGQMSVFIVEDDKAMRRHVKVGRQTTKGATITSGIDANQRVVIRGNEVLKDQQPVQISPSKP